MTLEKQLWMLKFLQRLLEGMRTFTAELFAFKTKFLVCILQIRRKNTMEKFQEVLDKIQGCKPDTVTGIINFMRKKGNKQQLLPNLLDVVLGVTWSWRSKCCQLCRDWRCWICHRILAKESAVTPLSLSTNLFGMKAEGRLKPQKRVMVFHTSTPKRSS